MWQGARLRPIQNGEESVVKSYLACVPIHSTRVCSAPLELFLQSLAKKLLCVMQQKQRFSNLQFGTRSVLWERFFILFVVRKNDTAWESTSLMWDVARCQTQTDTKPIGICSEILSCLCTYTLPHMYVQLRLNFSSRALLKSCCVSCSKFSFFLSFAVRDQIFSSGWAGPLPFICKTDTAWESTSLV